MYTILERKQPLLLRFKVTQVLRSGYNNIRYEEMQAPRNQQPPLCSTRCRRRLDLGAPGSAEYGAAPKISA